MGRIMRNLQRKKDLRLQYRERKREVKLQKKESGQGFFDKLGDGLRGGIFSKMTGGMIYGGESEINTGTDNVSGNTETSTGSGGSGFKISSIPFIPITLVLGLVFIAKKVFFNGNNSQGKKMNYA